METVLLTTLQLAKRLGIAAITLQIWRSRGLAYRLSNKGRPERCRRRTTPPSVRFLGRRVYPGFVLVLLGAMQSGVTDSRIDELRLSLGVARRTLQRWRHWWREIFVQTQFWQLARGRFMPSIVHAALPAGLLERFQSGDARSQLVQCLLFLNPLSVPGALRLREGR